MPPRVRKAATGATARVVKRPGRGRFSVRGPSDESGDTIKRYDALVVGAGFAGATVAERLASAGRSVLVVDRRPHVAGNAYDEYDEFGVLVHRYGPHIFHTNSARVFAYLSRFTAWRAYEHRVLARVGETYYPFPINLATLREFFSRPDLDERGARELLDRIREPRANIRTSEDFILDAVGPELYATFFDGYTRKQWGRSASELSASVAARVPVRTDSDDRYFTDRYQAMPRDGYSALVRRMLARPEIELALSTDYRELGAGIAYDHTVYTGPLDAFFDEALGTLPYRSLRFEFEHLPASERYQRVGTINYPGLEPGFTRITEFKYLTGQTHAGTTFVREYPTATGEPYYPIPAAENDALRKRYEALAAKRNDVTFVGRLALYRYFNMDQVVAAALGVAAKLGAASELSVA